MARLIQLALLCALCVASTDATGFLADSLVASKDPTNAKLASEYHADTEIACLKLMSNKNCRYTGCSGCSAGGSLDFNSFFYQTDFTCCPKERSRYGASHDSTDVAGSSDTVGTCDWDTSIFRWNDGAPNAYVTDERTAIKAGTAWGTCYLNSGAEQCDGPLCERMAISVQGGIFVACAYGDTEKFGLPATLEGTCKDSTTFIEVATVLISQGLLKLDGVCPVDIKPRAVADAWAKTPAKLASEHEYDSETAAPQLYAGQAIIISGPFYETSKSGNKVRETGLFEFTTFFSGGTAIGTKPVRKWPVVQSKTAKLRFTRGKEAY